MIFVETGSNRPEINLAFEEYFLKNFKEPVLMLWQNEPTVVVGRFQNTLEEINRTYIKENNINVIRRMTGGGAVYHDKGNLCYSFIVRNVNVEDADFSVFAYPIIQALGQIGIVAQQSGRNDILLDGKKVSGTAMSIYKDSLLFHGTLLYDSDLSVLTNALNVKQIKIISKGCKSVKSRVTNIKPYLHDKDLDVLEFKNILKNKLKEVFQFTEYEVSREVLNDIISLAEKKYKSWDWVYGNNPQYGIKNTRKFSGGIIETHLDVKAGKIKKCSIRGDFLGLCSIEDIENSLIDIPYKKEDVYRVLANFDIKKFFNSITLDEIIKCLFDEDEEDECNV